MSKHDSKEVAHAVLHEPLHHPDTGTLDKTLVSKASGQHKAVKMSLCEPFVLVEVPKASKAGSVKLLIPVTNFKSIQIAE